jgi:hypothetical protein
MNDVADKLLIYAAIPQTLFVLAYVATPWARWAPGRAIMLKAFALMLVLDLGFMYTVFGTTWVARPWVRLVCFGLIALGCTYQFLVCVKVQWFGLGSADEKETFETKRHRDDDPAATR